jgi:hypothetical protein
MISCVPQSPVEQASRPPAGSPGANPPVVLDQTSLAGRTIRILERQGRCVVETGGTEFSVEPTPPCFFLRRGGEVQNFPYPDAKVEWTLIVAGNALSEANRKTWNLAAGEVCGEKSQAVMLKSGQVGVSKAVHSGGVYCKDKGVDEKEFWSFAHDKQ